MPGLNDPVTADLPSLSQSDVLAMLDRLTKGEAPEAAPKPASVKGDAENEPESGESETPEGDTDEAETESDDKPEETEESEEEQPQRFRVKVDGKDVEVTLDELTAGYSREADYTRKTQALAEERRTWETQRDNTLKGDKDAVAKEREQYKSVLNVWGQQLSEALGANTDWESLRQQNPGEWSAKMTERHAMMQRLQGIQQEQARLGQEETSKRDEANRANLALQAKVTLDLIPEWKVTDKYKVDMDGIAAYAQSLKFTNQDLLSIADGRIMKVMHDAARYHALMAKAGKVKQTVDTVAKARPLKPGSAPIQLGSQAKVQKLASDQARRGDKRSTVALFEALLSKG